MTPRGALQGIAAVALVAVFIVVFYVAPIFLADYQRKHPFPPSERLFVPEWTCYSKYQGGYCERTGPPPRPLWGNQPSKP